MILYKNKYRTTSMRAQWWDYSWNGSYFITICTQNLIHYFGHVDNGEMIYSELGKIHKDFQWQSGYHDSIIRNQIAYNNISLYIQNNPSNWENDLLLKQYSI